MSQTDQTKTQKKQSFVSQISESIKNLNDSYTQFWKAKISWKVTIAIFLSILAIESFITYISWNEYRAVTKSRMLDTAKTTIAGLNFKYQGNKIVDMTEINTLLTSTNIQGIRVYTPQFSLVDQWGQRPSIALDTPEDLYKIVDDRRGFHYEAVFKPGDINHPYYVVARMDSKEMVHDIQYYAYQQISIVILLSALITTILMGALGFWFLQPIVYLTNLLKKAIRNPEHPDIKKGFITRSGNDDINEAIDAAVKLVTQNAEHIKQIKDTAEDEIRKLAYFDGLTNLPNRVYFIDQLKNHISKEKADTKFVVVALDLDHFRDVNDSMGHSVGDMILKSVGERLKKSLPERAVVARSGEDSFAVMLPIIAGINTAEDIAKRVALSVKAERFKVMDEDFRIHCSVGYALYPEDGDEPDQVLKNADVALNRAKEEGRDMIRAYSRDFDIAVQSRFQLLRDLRHALENEEFELHFQPQFDLKTAKIIGAEALLRWWKPDNSKEGGKYISPGEFIPIAESSGLIVPIGEWVLRDACFKGIEFKSEGLDDIRIAVNVSGVQFHQKDLVEQVQHTLHETGLDPKKLEIEVTESAFMKDVNHTIDVLRQLHEAGCELAIDDFGTGYSSLAYLRQFPIDRLKIDRSFIINALNNPDDASITRTIIALGKSLNLNVIAEGVETTDHEAFLKKEGCNEVQGFRYSRPLPKKKFVAFCKNYTGKLSQFNDS